MRHTPLDFILENQVFTLAEFQAEYRLLKKSVASAGDLLAYHVKEGRICSVRRGVYAHARWVDPWLLASKLTKNVLISHDGALSFHGVTHVGNQITFMTTERTTSTTFNEIVFQPLQVKLARLTSSVLHAQRGGQELMVTSLSRTLVDCLTELDRAPPPVELMELFHSTLAVTDPHEMVNCALRASNRLLTSRLAFFLWCTRANVSLEDTQRLNAFSLQRPGYFLRSARSKGDSLIARWNLIVPGELKAFWPRNH